MFFNQKNHKYYKNNLEKADYISASSVAKMYKKPFDEEYWSLYKAYEQLAGVANDIDLLDKESLKKNFRKYKKGYKIGDYKLFDHLKYFFNENQVKMVQKDFLDRWNTKREASLIKGTIHHDNQEQNDLEKGFKLNPWTGNTLKVIPCNKWLDEDTKVRTVDLDNLEDGYYAELIVDHWKFRGQIDKLWVENGYIYTDDYKTNEQIKKENRFQKMLGVLSHLDDCNWNDYRIQISIYNWILIQKGYKHGGSRLTHVKITPEEIIETIHPFDHMSKEIEDIVMDLSLKP